MLTNACKFVTRWGKIIFEGAVSFIFVYLCFHQVGMFFFIRPKFSNSFFKIRRKNYLGFFWETLPQNKGCQLPVYCQKIGRICNISWIRICIKKNQTFSESRSPHWVLISILHVSIEDSTPLICNYWVQIDSENIWLYTIFVLWKSISLFKDY